MSCTEQRLLGFIPARGGSVRALNKNARPIAGMSPIRRAVAAALAAGSLDDVAFSTDSADYLTEAAAAGAATVAGVVSPNRFNTLAAPGPSLAASFAANWLLDSSAAASSDRN